MVALAAAVRVTATGCQTTATAGAGSFVADGLVLTVAHVVAGSDDVQVVLADGSTVDATIVAIDRRTDLALLHVDAAVTPLPRGTMRRNAQGVFIAYRDGVATALSFKALAFVDIESPGLDESHGNDHEGAGDSDRRGYELRADVEPGDSGSVLVTDGVATGVVFARSTSSGRRAWAVDIAEAAPLFALATDEAVDTGPCV